MNLSNGTTTNASASIDQSGNGYFVGSVRADGGFKYGTHVGVTSFNTCGVNYGGGLYLGNDSSGCSFYDWAEGYGVEENVQRGEIVSLGSTTSSKPIKIINPAPGEKKNDEYTSITANVRRASAGERSRLLGIISTAPGNFEQAEADVKKGKGLVAMVGRVPTRMTLEGGDIQIGDPITISTSTPGAGMKAMSSGRIVGYALEPFNAKIAAGKSMIEVFVHIENWRSPADEAALASRLLELKNEVESLKANLKKLEAPTVH
jgi:hypothetical protein